MKLLFKQCFFSWLDSYDIFDEAGNTVYTVEGKMSFGHCLHVLDAWGNHVATLKEKVFTWMPKFEIYLNDNYAGSVEKELSFLKPRYQIDFRGWSVEGDFMEWDYLVKNGTGLTVAAVTKELFHMTDTYSIEVSDPQDALCALMLALAIDAEKCSRN